jgi:hypothetical protein
LQRWIAHPMVEQEGKGVRGLCAKQSACQVPHTSRAHTRLYGVTLSKLAKDGVYPVTKPTEEGTPFGVRLAPLGGGVWSQKLYAHTRQLLLSGLGRVVVTVPNTRRPEVRSVSFRALRRVRERWPELRKSE